MKNLKLINIVLLSTIIFSTCAKEQSAEERNREERDRKVQRLEKSIGEYQGKLKSENGYIPLDLEVVTKKNTGIDEKEPELVATMNIGFFGGVKAISTKTSFDSNTGELIADFSSPNRNLELKGYVKDESLIGTLTGSEQGSFDIELNTKSLSLFVNEKEYYYTISFKDESFMSGDLVFKPQADKLSTIVSHDLPYLPALETSFRFLGFGEKPILLGNKSTIYDPLYGTLEINISDSATIAFENIFYQEDGSLDNLEVMNGIIEIGQNDYQTITFTKSTKKLKNNFEKIPKFMVGTYQGARSNLTYNVIGNINKSGATLKNPSNVPFTTFPEMSLNIAICLGDEVYKEFNYKSISVDYAKKIIKMKNSNSSQIVEFTYTNNIESMDGIVVVNDDTTGSESGAKINVNESENRKTCKELND